MVKTQQTATQQTPILYSFRRCPYAMRARMGLLNAQVHCNLREVVLKDKPAELGQASAKATVPVLVLPEGRILDESLDILLWSLAGNDPDGWMDFEATQLNEMAELVAACDGDFKTQLDEYKYNDRHIEFTLQIYRHKAMPFLLDLNGRLKQSTYLFADRLSYADIAIFPFVRQFANVEPDWFAQAEFPSLRRWLNLCINSPLFKSVMKKYPQWKTGEPGINF